VEISPRKVREIVVGNPKATKIEVAEALVRQGFTDLAELVPKRPARAVLGLSEKDRYWLHAFDALALAASVMGGDTPPLHPSASREAGNV
jgi:hypothetical protein